MYTFEKKIKTCFCHPLKLLTGIPSNNKFSETIFGHLDRLLKEKSNISLIASEAFIMFVHNKIDWHSEKSDQAKGYFAKKSQNRC